MTGADLVRRAAAGFLSGDRREPALLAVDFFLRGTSESEFEPSVPDSLCSSLPASRYDFGCAVRVLDGFTAPAAATEVFPPSSSDSIEMTAEAAAGRMKDMIDCCPPTLFAPLLAAGFGFSGRLLSAAGRGRAGTSSSSPSSPPFLLVLGASLGRRSLAAATGRRAMPNTSKGATGSARTGERVPLSSASPPPSSSSSSDSCEPPSESLSRSRYRTFPAADCRRARPSTVPSISSTADCAVVAGRHRSAPSSPLPSRVCAVSAFVAPRAESAAPPSKANLTCSCCWLRATGLSAAGPIHSCSENTTSWSKTSCSTSFLA